jgi:hypothetical protein
LFLVMFCAEHKTSPRIRRICLSKRKPYWYFYCVLVYRQSLRKTSGALLRLGQTMFYPRRLNTCGKGRGAAARRAMSGHIRHQTVLIVYEIWLKTHRYDTLYYALQSQERSS